MKYLENLALENLTKAITNRELGGGLIINGKVETYSTKKAGDDKKTSKIIESKLSESLAQKAGVSGEAAELPAKSKKILGELIQTLNASMIDYDFSGLTPESFASISTSEAVHNINSFIAELTVNNPNFINDMWKDVSDSMGNLGSCEVYRLDDNIFLDEVENGMVWSFNYFFCSKELKRVCFFSCFASNKYNRSNHLDTSFTYDSDDEDAQQDMRYEDEADAMETSDSEHDRNEDSADDWP